MPSLRVYRRRRISPLGEIGTGKRDLLYEIRSEETRLNKRERKNALLRGKRLKKIRMKGSESHVCGNRLYPGPHSPDRLRERETRRGRRRRRRYSCLHLMILESSYPIQVRPPPPLLANGHRGGHTSALTEHPVSL